MVREWPYLTQYNPPLGSLIWVFRFSLQDIWLKSQYKIEIVIWMLVGAQGPIMQGFSGLLAGWIKDLAGSLKNLNFTKFIQIQCFEGWHENIHLPSTHISPLGNHLVWVKISNLPMLPSWEILNMSPWWVNREKLRNHWPSKYKHGLDTACLDGHFGGQFCYISLILWIRHFQKMYLMYFPNIFEYLHPKGESKFVEHTGGREVSTTESFGSPHFAAPSASECLIKKSKKVLNNFLKI